MGMSKVHFVYVASRTENNYNVFRHGPSFKVSKKCHDVFHWWAIVAREIGAGGSYEETWDSGEEQISQSTCLKM